MTRSDGLAFLRQRLADEPGLRARLGFADVRSRSFTSRVVTSKRYRADESATRRPSWWHQLPEEKLPGDGALILLCADSVPAFHVLVVPRAWLQANQHRLDSSGGRLQLFLSAEPDDRFLERRRSGLDFSRWLVE